MSEEQSNTNEKPDTLEENLSTLKQAILFSLTQMLASLGFEKNSKHIILYELCGKVKGKISASKALATTKQDLDSSCGDLLTSFDDDVDKLIKEVENEVKIYRDKFELTPSSDVKDKVDREMKDEAIKEMTNKILTETIPASPHGLEKTAVRKVTLNAVITDPDGYRFQCSSADLPPFDIVMSKVIFNGKLIELQENYNKKKLAKIGAEQESVRAIFDAVTALNNSTVYQIEALYENCCEQLNEIEWSILLHGSESEKQASPSHASESLCANKRKREPGDEGGPKEETGSNQEQFHS